MPLVCMKNATTNVMSDKLRSTVPLTQWFIQALDLFCSVKAFSISYSYVVFALHQDLRAFYISINTNKVLIYMISTFFT